MGKSPATVQAILKLGGDEGDGPSNDEEDEDEDSDAKNSSASEEEKESGQCMIDYLMRKQLSLFQNSFVT